MLKAMYVIPDPHLWLSLQLHEELCWYHSFSSILSSSHLQDSFTLNLIFHCSWLYRWNFILRYLKMRFWLAIKYYANNWPGDQSQKSLNIHLLFGQFWLQVRSSRGWPRAWCWQRLNHDETPAGRSHRAHAIIWRKSAQHPCLVSGFCSSESTLH